MQEFSTSRLRLIRDHCSLVKEGWKCSQNLEREAQQPGSRATRLTSVLVTITRHLIGVQKLGDCG